MDILKKSVTLLPSSTEAEKELHFAEMLFPLFFGKTEGEIRRVESAILALSRDRVLRLRYVPNGTMARLSAHDLGEAMAIHAITSVEYQGHFLLPEGVEETTSAQKVEAHVGQ